MDSNRNGRLKILVNGLAARRGGVQTYLINLLRFMPDDATAVVFVLAPDDLPLPVDRQNIKKVSVNWPVDNPFVRAVWERICLPKLVRQLQADLLFCPGGIIGASLPSECKTIAMSRNMLPFDRMQSRKYPLGYMRIRHWILQKVLMKDMLRAGLVIFISEFGRDTIQAYSEQHIENAVVIPHGIDQSFRVGTAEELPRLNWLPSGEYLLYASEVNFHKYPWVR
jgi:glycosyltransferase involved in cell wall biosynthesis